MKLQELQNLRNIVKQDSKKESLLILLEELVKLREENNRLNKQIQKMSKEMIAANKRYKIIENDLNRRANNLDIRAIQLAHDEERVMKMMDQYKNYMYSTLKPTFNTFRTTYGTQTD